MPRAALTGAGGFIGRTVVERLCAAGWQVRALMRRSAPELAEAGVDVVQGSLEDEASLGRLVAETDAVVHCAGAVRGRAPGEFLTVNQLGTRRLVAAAGAAPARPRVLLVSSLAAREPNLSAYALSKRLAEEELRAAADRFDYLIVRPTAVYGPRDRATLPLFRQLARGRVVLPARASNRFSLLYVEDLASALVHLLDVPSWGGAVLELDDGRSGGYTWNTVLGIAARQLDHPVRSVAPPQPLLWTVAAANELLSGAVRRAPFFTRGKLRELSHPDWTCREGRVPALRNWSPEFQFEQGLPATLAGYRARGWL